MNKSKSIIKKIIVCAILAALGFVLDRFLGVTLPLFGVRSLSINISFIPIFLSGFLYGPVWGALVGGVQDILCVILVPLGAFNPGITVTTMLAGALAGVFGMIFFNPKKISSTATLSVDVKKSSNPTVVYSVLAVSALASLVLMFVPVIDLTVGENAYSLSVWEMITAPEAYKNAYIAVLDSFGYTGSELVYMGQSLSDTFALISCGAAAGLIFTVFSAVLFLKKKNAAAILSSAFGFILSGVGCSTMIFYIPKTLANTEAAASSGIAAYLLPLLSIAVLITVLVNTDTYKFALAAFSVIVATITSILNSFWISLTVSTTFWAFFPPRLVFALFLSAPLYSFILYYLMKNAVPALQKSKLL